MPASFIDTNVLIYLASSDTIKADRAEQTVAAGGIISVQVLNELANVARRKLRLPWQQTREFLSTIRSLLEVRPVTADVHQAGLAVAERYGLSIYDAMIVAAALDAGCTTLWSEDMQDGLLIEGQLRVANPF
ncbi:MAG: PIN domain-containing protein [Proteobacteria bacterium]|uniref:PIN domain-containing protein n=1 Tax=Acidiphilium sp. PA TaxID=2871705 RepID=UPI002243B607|nr:PIN domain-containing protein [Acidiphilium sp. PA]MBW4035697.1 PIN domain-containing protein [Pseudomonadota bacterium]MCW8305693.1 PIN domain-containing protein [Acidiphilium sp. PA]